MFTSGKKARHRTGSGGLDKKNYKSPSWINSSIRREMGCKMPVERQTRRNTCSLLTGERFTKISSVTKWRGCLKMAFFSRGKVYRKMASHGLDDFSSAVRNPRFGSLTHISIGMLPPGFRRLISERRLSGEMIRTIFAFPEVGLIATSVAYQKGS